MGGTFMITKSEIVELYEDCTKLLTYVGNAGIDSDDLLEEIGKLKEITKKLSLAEKLMNENMICVTGRQGAGKTTFIRNFLGLDSQYFYIDDGECELVPVLIKGKNIQNIEMYCEFLDIREVDGKRNYVRNIEKIDSAEYFRELSGKRSINGREILSLELALPDANMKLGNLTFLLLPGHVGDDENEDVDNLIELSIAGSDTAVYVLHPNDLPDDGNKKLMESVLEKFRDKAIFLITWSDRYTSETINEYRKTCMEKLELNDITRVIPVGSGNESEWVDIVWHSLNKHMKSGIQANRNMFEYVKKIVRTEIRPCIRTIRALMNESEAEEIGKEYKNDFLIKMFQKERTKLKKKYDSVISSELNKAKKEDQAKLYDIIEKGNIKFLKRALLKARFSDVKDMGDMLEKAMKFSGDIYNYQKAMVNAIAQVAGATIKDEKMNMLCRNDDIVDAEYMEIEDNDAKKIVTKNQAMLENAVMFISKDNYGEIVRPSERSAAGNEFLEDNMRVTCQLGACYLATALLAGVGNSIESSVVFKNNEFSLDDMRNNITDSQKFLVGMLGVSAVDIVGDGTFDLIPNLAGALEGVLQTLFPELNPNLVKGGLFGAGKAAKVAEVKALSLQVATKVACGVVGIATVAGMVRTIYNDVNSQKVNDYLSGCQVIENAYKEIKKSYMNVFDDYMDEIEERIKSHLRAKDGGTIRGFYGYNAGIVLDRIEQKISELYEKMNVDDLRKFEAIIVND